MFDLGVIVFGDEQGWSEDDQEEEVKVFDVEMLGILEGFVLFCY